MLPLLRSALDRDQASLRLGVSRDLERRRWDSNPLAGVRRPTVFETAALGTQEGADFESGAPLRELSPAPENDYLQAERGIATGIRAQ